MIDFKRSFDIGLDSARLAESNRAEISAVFDELNRQIDAASEGKIVIQREQFEEPSENPFRIAIGNRPKYWAICARHKIHTSAELWELAKWHQGSSGYPCKITRKEADIFCENKEALELALAELLQDPSVGTVFFKLLSYQPTT
jgi:hypothetical protein